MNKLNIVHLYPELLNLYADRGNMLTLEHYAKKINFEVNIQNVSLGDHFPDVCDLIIIGGGHNKEQIKVSEDLDLVDLSFFLKDDTGSVYVGGNGFGEVAMQMINGEAYGIDTSYAGDEEELIDRASNVYDDDGSEFPVHFYDFDMSGDLSPGDSFEIYGLGEYINGPAADNWIFDLMFDPTGDVIGSVTLM